MIGLIFPFSVGQRGLDAIFGWPTWQWHRAILREETCTPSIRTRCVPRWKSISIQETSSAKLLSSQPILSSLTSKTRVAYGGIGGGLGSPSAPYLMCVRACVPSASLRRPSVCVRRVSYAVCRAEVRCANHRQSTETHACEWWHTSRASCIREEAVQQSGGCWEQAAVPRWRGREEGGGRRRRRRQQSSRAGLHVAGPMSKST